MEDNITFTFMCDGATLLLDETEYGVTNYEGLEATDYEIEKTVNINHIGARKKRKKLLSRLVSIEFDYLGQDENKPRKRQELIRFFSPFSAGMLTVNYLGVERQIEYEVIVFDTSGGKMIAEPLSCLVELECMDPAFSDVKEQSEVISTWIGGWSFPFTLPFRLKTRGEPKTNIYNSGHMEAPVVVEFHGPAVNPYVKNLTTGKLIKLETELTSDQVLFVDTTFGKNTVEIEENGVRRDVSQLISVDTRFWRLQVGDNMVEYGSDNALQDNNVVIRYRNRYLGI